MAKSATVVAELRSTASVNKQGTKKSSASKKGSAKKPKKRTKKRSIFNIKRNILDMLQTRDDGIVTISKGAMTELHNMVRDMTDKLIQSSLNLASHAKRTLINPRDVQAAVKFTFRPGTDLTSYMCNNANGSLLKFLTN